MRFERCLKLPRPNGGSTVGMRLTYAPNKRELIMSKPIYYSSLAWLLPTLSLVSTSVQPLVDNSWIKANGCNAGVVMLDIRSEKIDGQSVNDYLKGHLPCAVHTDYHTAGWRTKRKDTPGMLPPVEKLESLIGKLGIDNDTHVVITPRGNSAKPMGAATRIYWTFKVLGHDKVSILNGGTEGFAANKANTLEPGMRDPRPKSFKATLRSNMLVTRKDIQRSQSGKYALIDYRGPDQFLGINRHPKVK
jgi:thiosulfate/3-mercaptopyruvate sulfurtransferase